MTHSSVWNDLCSTVYCGFSPLECDSMSPGTVLFVAVSPGPRAVYNVLQIDFLIERMNIKKPTRIMWAILASGRSRRTRSASQIYKAKCSQYASPVSLRIVIKQYGMTTHLPSWPRRVKWRNKGKMVREEQSLRFSKLLLSEKKHIKQWNSHVKINGPWPYQN